LEKFISTQSAQRLKTFEISSKKINTVDQFFLIKNILSLEKLKIIFKHAKEDQYEITTYKKNFHIININDDTD
jgi:hypothetical protein